MGMSTNSESTVQEKIKLDNGHLFADQLTDVDYYTKAEVNARLALKADADDLEKESDSWYVNNNTNWKVTIRRIAVGIVSIRVNLNNTYPATHSGGYEDILTGIPAKYRPAENVYFMAADYNNNERVVGVYHSGIVRVYDSVSTGCYGATSYMT